MGRIFMNWQPPTKLIIKKKQEQLKQEEEFDEVEVEDAKARMRKGSDLMLEKINENPELEATHIIKFIEKRLKDKLACNILFTGELGKGKSYAGLRLLELWYKKRFNKEVPKTHICKELDDAMRLIRKFTIKDIGEMILIEELSVLIGVRASLTKANRTWNKFMDIVRIKQCIILGNAPSLLYLDKHMVSLCQIWIDVLGYRKDKKITIIKPQWLNMPTFRHDPYHHYFKNKETGNKIKWMVLKKAENKELTNYYDKFKDKSVNEDVDECIEEIVADRRKRNKDRNKIDLKQQVEVLLKRLGKVALVAKALGISKPAVYMRLNKNKDDVNK